MPNQDKDQPRGKSAEAKSKAGGKFQTLIVDSGVSTARIDCGRDQDVVVPRGQIRAADGGKLKGAKPNFSVTQDDTGATVSFTTPPSAEIQLRYKLEAVDEDDEA